MDHGEANRTIPEMPEAGTKKAAGASFWFTALISFLCALSPLLITAKDVIPGVIPVVLLAVLFLYVVRMARMPGTVLTLLLSAVLPVIFTSMFSAGALFLSVSVGTMAAAYLMMTARFPVVGAIPSVGALIVMLIVTGDWQVSLLSLALLPAAYFLSHATAAGMRRVSSIARAEVGLLLVLVLIALAVVFRSRGSISPDTLRAYAEEARERLSGYLIGARDELKDLLMREGQPSEQAEMEKLFGSVLDDVTIRNAVSGLFNLLPGICAVLCGVAAYEAQIFLTTALIRNGHRQKVSPVSLLFAMHPIPAILFLLSFLLAVVTDGTSFFSVVVTNLYLIFLPGFCLTGVQLLLLMFTRSGGLMRIIVLLGIFSLFCTQPFLALCVIGFCGAGFTLFAFFRAFRSGSGSDSSGSPGDGEPR